MPKSCYAVRLQRRRDPNASSKNARPSRSCGAARARCSMRYGEVQGMRPDPVLEWCWSLRVLYTGTILRWYRTGTAPVLHWYCTGTVSALYWRIEKPGPRRAHPAGDPGPKIRSPKAWSKQGGHRINRNRRWGINQTLRLKLPQRKKGLGGRPPERPDSWARRRGGGRRRGAQPGQTNCTRPRGRAPRCRGPDSR